MPAAGRRRNVPAVSRKRDQHSRAEQPRPRSAAGVSSATRRVRSTATRLAMRCTSSRLCVEIRTARRSPRRRRIRSRTSRALSGSSPDVGSSSSTISGLCSSVRASATRCFSPFESCAARSSLPVADVEEIERLVDGARRVRAGRAAAHRRAGSLPTVSRSHRPGASVRKPMRPRRRGAARRDIVSPSMLHARRGRIDQPGQHPQRGRLAGAVGTEQREDLARHQLERHVVDGDARFEAAREV